MAEMINIEVVYASPEIQFIQALRIPRGTTVGKAIQLSKWQEQCPGCDLEQHKVGIFSEIVPLEHVLSEGDRLEIYRSLRFDPKENRRRKARDC